MMRPKKSVPFNPIGAASDTRHLLADRPIAALLLGYGLPLPYNVTALVGVWRSAARHEGKRLHAELARIVTPVLILVLSLL
jgi:hypothetical protein